MAFSLKNKIFKMFGNRIAVEDSYKDAEGKGIFQRYNELCAEDYDTELALQVQNLIDNIFCPETAQSEFLSYLEYQIGESVFLGTSEALRRKAIRYATKLYAIKGTKPGYEVPLYMIGMTSVVIIEHAISGTFDAGNTTSDIYAEPTFDDPNRTFDGSCPTCSDYTLKVYTDLPLTAEMHKAIFRIIAFNEPINARLREVYFNDDLLILNDLLSIYIDSGGNLIYEDSASPLTYFSLSADGDLSVGGQDEEKYSLDDNGNVIYTD